MRVYIEISKNHGYSLDYIISNKFSPEIQLLIMYYNYVLRLEAKEYEELENKRKEEENMRNGGVSTWQTQ